MFDSSPLPMWMYDHETLRFLAVNDAAIRHYGFSRDEFLAMTIAEIRPPEDVAALIVDVEKAAGFVESQRWRHRRKDGSLITVEIEANDLTIDGRSVRLVLVTDITARLTAEERLGRTEEQLRQAQKMEAIGRLAGGVAHDFNNLLTVIQAYACMLEEGLEGHPLRADAVEIRLASERATALTRQLLAMSRHSIAAPRSVDLDEIIVGFTSMMRRLLGEQVTVVTHLRGVPAVIADPGQVEQVLMNLAVNARDAMGGSGRLTIETDLVDVGDDRPGVPPGRQVVVAVTDTGTGMDRETQAQIFEPFFTTKGPGEGTGIGLAMVHGIVSQAGGAITVYSEPGHGTTFRVFWPVATEEVTQPVEVPTPEVTTLPPLTILVVDDDRDVRGATVRILRDAGCTVLEAASAEEMRQRWAAAGGAVDVAVLDVILPDGRGDQLANELRGQRPELEIILISGYPAGALTPHGGAPPDLLAKPFTPGALRAAVARVAR